MRELSLLIGNINILVGGKFAQTSLLRIHHSLFLVSLVLANLDAFVAMQIIYRKQSWVKFLCSKQLEEMHWPISRCFLLAIISPLPQYVGLMFVKICLC